MRPGVRNAVLEPPGPIDRRFNTSKNTVKNEFSRRIIALKFQNTPEPRSSRGVSISALTRRRVNLYIDGGVPSLVQSRSWTPGSLFGEVIFDAVKIFAQHFLIAGRGRRKPEAFRAGAVGLSVALEYLETIGGIDLSVEGIVPKFHSSRSEVALMAS